MAVAAMAASAPGIALACPYCAGRSQGTIWTNVILGCFVFLPFLMAWVVYRVVRSQDDVIAPRPTAAFPEDPHPPTFNRSRRHAS